ncbi:ATP-dependent zinc metalloprotease FTSH 10, mitochondrial [Haematococcus lacustris]|uniref:ATP-dependent zinc metalloprotease FTSH 10, mitochondrial n=1 Tax=Haematococcus lacustris TaxID=44745 RepID=A0A699YRZ9_HAELA|nr:ATP-dependent zinc metalloprotease FTSH 10, mitochondrial [Haematococcus lacustris]
MLPGMNDKVGLLSYRMDRDAFDKPYSNETAHMIDTEVRDFVDSAYKRTLALVEQHKDLITAMSMDLLKKEEGDVSDANAKAARARG